MVILQAQHINTKWITTYHVMAVPQMNTWNLIINFVNQQSLKLIYHDETVFKDLKKIDADLTKGCDCKDGCNMQ